MCKIFNGKSSLIIPLQAQNKAKYFYCLGCILEDAYSSGHLVLSHFGLAFVLMLTPFFPELVMSTDLLSFEHPSVLLFCLTDKTLSNDTSDLVSERSHLISVAARGIGDISDEGCKMGWMLLTRCCRYCGKSSLIIQTQNQAKYLYCLAFDIQIYSTD